jgi:hypothetical protein
MSTRVRTRIRGRQRRQGQQYVEERGRRNRRMNRSPAVLLLLLLVWSICLGWGLSLIAGATVKPDIVAQAPATELGTVDPVSDRYQLGKELYLENCTSCHVALPPEVLPSETWRRLLLEPEQHYGQKLQPIIGPSLVLMWNYLGTYSRPEKPDEKLPYRVAESRYFKALHPRVEFSGPARPASCVSCHPAAAQYNYRRLTPESANSR